MTVANDSPPDRHSRQVFISYASEDKAVASRVAAALRESGWGVWIDQWELTVGDSIVERVSEGVATSDVLLVLLSSSSVRSEWIRRELTGVLSKQLKDRAISVVPAIIEDCEIPPELEAYRYIDLRHDLAAGIGRLTAELSAARRIDFSRLTSEQFENLVRDLLVELGFEIQPALYESDSGFDSVAVYRYPDPFGGERIERWLVEAKLYRDQRVSVSLLQQMMGYLLSSPTATKALLITSGGITSVAGRFLEELKERRGQGLEFRVIDGQSLAKLLMPHLALVARYFGTSEGDEP